MLILLVFVGFCNDVLTYPNKRASYPVPVRQFRLLPFGLLQCMGHPKPPCHLLMLPGVTPVHKRLSLSGLSLIQRTFIKFTIQGTHILYMSERFKLGFESSSLTSTSQRTETFFSVTRSDTYNLSLAFIVKKYKDINTIIMKKNIRFIYFGLLIISFFYNCDNQSHKNSETTKNS